jgi:hypothetical protein
MKMGSIHVAGPARVDCDQTCAACGFVLTPKNAGYVYWSEGAHILHWSGGMGTTDNHVNGSLLLAGEPPTTT